MQDLKFFKLDIVDRIAILTLAYPPLNLLSIDLMVELRMVLETLNTDPDVRCIILTGEGKAFCAGFELGTSKLPRGMNASLSHLAFQHLDMGPLPVIAAINGYALGGGLEMALACDIRIASDKAKIGLVEASLGILAAFGGNTRLPWLIGESKARRLFFTAERLTAEQALEYGVVSEVVPHEQLMNRAMELARQITANAPRSIATAKDIMFQFREPLFAAGYRREQLYSAIVGKTKDAKEGTSALREKRKPVFKNE